MADKSEGLTQAGIVGLNQSIEAFVYCIFGAHHQREFLVLVVDAIRKPDISKSVQSFKLTIGEAKVRLDPAL